MPTVTQLWTVVAEDPTRLLQGTGSPEGVLTAEEGSLYVDKAGFIIYGKATGDDANGWAALGDGVASLALSGATPQPIGTATAGVATDASKGDHVHAHGNLAGGSFHALAIAAGAAGFLSGTDKAAIDALAATYATLARQIISGAGLTGGGSLAADRTLVVGANADGSIVVNADDIQVGILATDAQHGNRGGGSLHALAIASGAAGFLSGTDKAKIDGVASGATKVNAGTATLDFGSFPGKSDASVDVTGQTDILAGSFVQAWLYPTATADHTADEHLVEGIRIVAGNIVPGVGFTIYGINTSEIAEPLQSPGVATFRSAASTVYGYAAPSVGGTGTLIYGTWTVKWSWV